VRLGRVITAFVHHLEKSAQRLLIAPLAEQLFAALVIRIVDLAAEGCAVAALAANCQEQEQQQPAGQVRGARRSPQRATGKGLNAGNSGVSSPHAHFQHKS
jgi:hypothetical protein